MGLISFVHQYGYLAVFVGTFFEGETVLLAAAYAAHRGYLDPLWVITLATGGSFLGDQTFFWIGRRWGGQLLRRFPKLSTGIDRMDSLLHRYQLVVIVFMRFLYGLRIAGPVAIGMSQLSRQRFLFLNFLSATAWAVVVGATGFGISIGENYLVADLSRYDEYLLAGILIAGFTFWVVMKWRAKRSSTVRPSIAQFPEMHDRFSTRFHQSVLAKCTSVYCRAIWGIGSAFLALGIVALHDFVGSHPALFVVLLLPTLMATLRLGLAPGLSIAILGAGLMLWIDLQMVTSISPAMLTFNAILRLSVFSLVAWGGWKIIDLSRALHTLSHTDSLTGLGNHRAFMMRGDEELQRARRGQLALSVLFIDLDNFKAVNDNSGHDKGDTLLKIVAAVLEARLRQSDFAARLGGDEFGLILYDTDGPGAHVVAQQIHSDLNDSFKISGHPVTSSIGAVTFHHLPDTFEEVLKRADALMYDVKRGSKNAVLHQEISIPEMERANRR